MSSIQPQVSKFWWLRDYGNQLHIANGESIKISHSLRSLEMTLDTQLRNFYWFNNIKIFDFVPNPPDSVTAPATGICYSVPLEANEVTKLFHRGVQCLDSNFSAL